MPQERKNQAPSRSILGEIPEPKPTAQTEKVQSRRHSRPVAGPAELDNDDHPRTSILVNELEKDYPRKSSGFFSFLNRNPFNYSKPSKGTSVAPVKEEKSKEKSSSSPTESLGSRTSTTSTISSRSSRSSTSSSSSGGSISSISSKGSFEDVTTAMDEFKPSEKQKKAYVATGTPPPPPKMTRKKVVKQPTMQKTETIEKQDEDALYKGHKGSKKSRKKGEVAPQILTRRIRTQSFLSVQRSHAKVHPSSKSPKSSKRTKKSTRRAALDTSKPLESPEQDRPQSRSKLVSETATATDNATTTANPPLKSQAKVDSRIHIPEETPKTENTTVPPPPPPPESNNKPDDESQYKTWRQKLGLRNDVIRLRNSRNSQLFRFTPMNGGDTSSTAGGSNRRNSRASYVPFVNDPLRQDNIRRATDYKGWIKSAHLALPSKIGVPVEDSDDVLKAGVDAVEKVDTKNADPRQSYKQVLDNMQKHVRKTMYRGKVLHMGHEPETYGRRVSTLRLIPDHLTNKREHKKVLIAAGSDEEVNVNKLERIKAAIVAWLKKKAGAAFTVVHNFFIDVSYYCTIWRSSIRYIHGRFGITTARFVFLIIPEFVIDLTDRRPYNAEPTKGCYPEIECKSFIPKINKRLKFSVEDFITGEGMMENSYMYFSGYRDNTAQPFCPLKPVANLDKQYQSPLSVTAFRFLVVGAIILITNTVFISSRIIDYYHTQVHGNVHKSLFRMILCAWDFNCTDPEGAKALHKSIRREFRELSGGLQKEREEFLKTAMEEHSKNVVVSKLGRKWGQILIHWLLNAAVFFVCGCASTGVYFAYYSRILWIENEEDECNAYEPPPTLLLIAPALFISITSEVMTWFCAWCSKFETWKTAEYKNATTFGRIGLYYIAMIAAIYGYAYEYSQFLVRESKKEGFADIIYTLCYEEKIGEEIYRVVVLHGLVHGLTSWVWILYHWIRRKISKGRYTKRPIFDPTYHALDIFFVHAICGFGYVYCPLVSLIFITRLLVLFYSHKHLLSKYCSLPDHLSYVSEVSLPYFVAFLISYFISTLLNVYIYVELDSSFTCGPFTHFHTRKASAGEQTHYYSIIGDVFVAMSSREIRKLAQPGLLWVVIIFVLGLIHLFRCWANAYATTLENLKELLVYEKKDRDFLLQAIYNVVKDQNNSDDDFDDEDGNTGTPEDYEPKSRASSWQDTPLAEGIFESRDRNMEAHHHAIVGHGHHSEYINSHEDLSKPNHHGIRKSLLPSHKSSVPNANQDHLKPRGTTGTRKVSVADVWIQAYLELRRDRRKSEEMKKLKKMFGSTPK